jgi:hypothetical protein
MALSRLDILLKRYFHVLLPSHKACTQSNRESCCLVSLFKGHGETVHLFGVISSRVIQRGLGLSDLTSLHHTG